jgi:hypothetical protein
LETRSSDWTLLEVPIVDDVRWYDAEVVPVAIFAVIKSTVVTLSRFDEALFV